MVSQDRMDKVDSQAIVVYQVTAVLAVSLAILALVYLATQDLAENQAHLVLVAIAVFLVIAELMVNQVSQVSAVTQVILE